MTTPDVVKPDLNALPSDLPEPVDDGACVHLTEGTVVPSIALPATDGSLVDVSTLSGRSVVFIYPRTGQPGQALPAGWNEIPGARGCTPQSCRFRDLHEEFTVLGARVFGLSSQDTDYQREAAARLHLPYLLLSDYALSFASALSLPTFEAGGMTLHKRVTLVVNDGLIQQVYYPVFPPDRATDQVLSDLGKW